MSGKYPVQNETQDNKVHNERVINTARPGDILSFDRGNYKHYGVYGGL